MFPKKLFLFLIYLWLFLAALVGVTSWVAPFIVENRLAAHFNEQGRDITIEGFSLNLFTASVEIEGMVISQDQKPQAKFELLSLSADLQSLLQGKVVIDGVDISGLELTLLKTGNSWQLYGITLPPAEASAKSSEPDIDTSNASDASWPIYLDRLSIADSRLNVIENDRRDEFFIEALDVTKLSLEGDELITSVQLQMAVNKLPWKLGGEVSVSSKGINVEAETEQVSLALPDIAHYAGDALPDDLKLNHGQIDIANQLSLSIIDDVIDVTLKDSNIALKELGLSQADMALDIEALLLEKQLQLTINQSAELDVPEISFDIAGQLNVEALQLQQPSSGDILASSQNVTLPEFKIVQQAEQPLNVEITELLLDMVKLSQVNQEELPAALIASAVKVEQIAITEQSLSIDKVNIQGLENALLFDEQQVLKTLVSLGDEQKEQQETEVQPAQSAKAEAIKQGEEALFAIDINEVVIAPQSNIKIEDLSHKVPLKRSFVIEQFVVKNLQNISPQKGGKDTHATVIAKAGKYGLVKAEMTMPWIKDVQTFDGMLEVKNLSLPQYSAYLNQAAGISITAGQLDLVLDMKVVDGQFNGEAILHFRGLKLGEQSEDDEGAVHDKSTIGLNTALYQLADDKGNFEIDVPIEGQLDDIDIGTGGLIALVVEKALYQSAKSYVFNTMVPYGLVASIAIEAGQELFKIRLNDLLFNAGQVTLDDEQYAFVTELSAMMTKYPDIQVEVCSFVTSDEVKEQLGNDGDNRQAASVVLNELGSQRADALKDLLVTEYQIKPSRLLLCSPQLDDDKDAKPRLEFDIN